QALLERLDQVAIDAGQQAVGEFDDGHLAAEGGVDVTEFEADVTAADDEQRRRQRLQFQRTGRVHDPRRVEHQRGGARWRRAAGEDAMAVAVTAAVVQLHRLRIDELASPVDEVDLAAPTEAVDAARQAVYDLHPVAADRVEVDLRRLEVQSEVGRVARVGDE